MSREDMMRILRLHPRVVDVRPSEDNNLGLITVLFDDGTSSGINPEMANPLTADESEEDRIARIHRTLDVMKANGKTSDQLSLQDVVPLVRSADYFAPRPDNAAPSVVAWLTDFIGLGLAIDEPDLLRIINDSQMPEQHDHFDDLQFQSQAIENLRTMAGNMTFSEIGLGPDVLVLDNPDGNEAAWFADVKTMESLLFHLWTQTDTYWVVIPARRSQLFLVNSETDQWDALLDLLNPAIDAHDGIHPVPHIIVDDTWVSKLPPRDTELGMKLRMLELKAQHRLHSAIQSVMQEHSEVFLATFEVRGLNDDVISTAIVAETMDETSVPSTDMLVFAREDNTIYLVPSDKVLNEFPHLVREHPNFHPPRWIIARPSDEDYTTLSALSIM
ncbi:hypothetical protein [Corynebacterium durum]|uniref:hypothetical protein n=1 Tax=Corynebacterium durum TaxID=61592 RepID=UPI0040296D9C